MDVKDIVRHELIGLKVEVVDSKNESDIGIKGRVVDETKSTLTILDDQKKKLVKSNVVLEIEFQGKKIRVEGEMLAKRPEDRIKK
ncbi:ribonuclease P protein subunit [Candidatus Woesearchaeota archaeon]|nr:ribonuclease P protein subunit [Candidatus Woesearchaeota archaeon]MBW3021522.1 ribonuclease P protein subunit [Candidatus Woesearchaeota archaeon]